MNMSEYSIVGLTVTQCVHSLQVFICLAVYAYFRGQIQCEEMTVAVTSAVVGSNLTRITGCHHAGLSLGGGGPYMSLSPVLGADKEIVPLQP